jgi:RimJ/RimL family protein N-acetyltransferase
MSSMRTREPFVLEVPRIATERLLLRELRTTDFAAFAKDSEDPVAMRFMSGVRDRRASWRVFAALAGGWALTGAGWWAVEVQATGAFAGVVGAFFREWSLDRGRDRELELGWSLLRRFWGKGYAREAARAALAHASSRHDAARVCAYLDAKNVASAKVAEAIGLKPAGTADFYGQPAAVYVLPAAAVSGRRPRSRAPTARTAAPAGRAATGRRR